MRGRAGRKGKDEVGESYICCQSTDLDETTQLLEADLPALTSSLAPEKRGIKRYGRSRESHNSAFHTEQGPAGSDHSQASDPHVSHPGIRRADLTLSNNGSERIERNG